VCFKNESQHDQGGLSFSLPTAARPPLEAGDGDKRRRERHRLRFFCKIPKVRGRERRTERAFSAHSKPGRSAGPASPENAERKPEGGGMRYRFFYIMPDTGGTGTAISAKRRGGSCSSSGRAIPCPVTR